MADELNSPKVSVLIPVYNRESFIGECIRSALAQTFSDIEVIVVDNASTDGTWGICRQFAATDSRVRVFRNSNNIGPVRNWISCVEHARGEYAKILFSDDLLESNCVEKMICELSDPRVGFVFCATRNGESKANSKLHYSGSKSTLLSREEYLKLLLAYKAPFSPGAILFRTCDLRRNLHCDFRTATLQPFASHGAGPDVMVSLLTMLSYPFVFRLDEPLVFFRAHEGSFSVSNRNNQITEGYTSVIAFFLKNYYGWWWWIRYVACAWFDSCYSNRKLLKLRSFLATYEGVGSVGELLVSLFIIIGYGSRVIFGKGYRKLSAQSKNVWFSLFSGKL